MENTTYSLAKLLKLIKYPLITEKSYKVKEKNHYTFIGDKKVRKDELKFLFEKIFNIKIKKINTLILAPKFKKNKKNFGRKSIFKKIIITPYPNSSLSEIFPI